MPKEEEERTRIGVEVEALPRWGAGCRARATERGAPRAAEIWARISGLRAPPPETMSCWILCFGRTKRCRASTTERAVNTVAGRMRAAGLARWRRPRAMSLVT